MRRALSGWPELAAEGMALAAMARAERDFTDALHRYGALAGLVMPTDQGLGRYPAANLV